MPNSIETAVANAFAAVLPKAAAPAPGRKLSLTEECLAARGIQPQPTDQHQFTGLTAECLKAKARLN